MTCVQDNVITEQTIAIICNMIAIVIKNNHKRKSSNNGENNIFHNQHTKNQHKDYSTSDNTMTIY